MAHPGLIGAIEQIYPKALRQRCLIHRCRNLLAKVPAGMRAQVKGAYWKIFDIEGLSTTRRRLALARDCPARGHRLTACRWASLG